MLVAKIALSSAAKAVLALAPWLIKYSLFIAAWLKEPR
jgi:hypothetical protein